MLNLIFNLKKLWSKLAPDQSKVEERSRRFWMVVIKESMHDFRVAEQLEDQGLMETALERIELAQERLAECELK